MEQRVINCLKYEMKISWSHFEREFSRYTSEEQLYIEQELTTLFDASAKVRNDELQVEQYDKLYAERGYESNDLLEAMFYAFKEWQEYQGVALHKSLYEHTNRNTDYWFPVVIIEEPINNLNLGDEYIELYRGCSLEQFTSKEYQKRQSWTSDIDVAKQFAYHHPSQDTLRSDRVVIKAKIRKSDILWIRDSESEYVIRMNFIPKSASICMTYDDYKSEGSA
ncbi:hypothetical protein NTE29_004875 [Vibrio harveyi]|nr:hypothetical protein [Vibrio harveyi]